MTASIAQEATDGIPIVNQILGAVSRILKLAEKIEKDREALHALADKSQKLARRITAVLKDRTPDGEIVHSLESVRAVLNAVQALFEKHVAKTRVRRAISYLLAVPRDVERLSAELDDALQEFLLTAALDTNVRVQENSRTVGPLRRLHDFEIEKLDLVVDLTSEHGACMVKYHTARVEGAGRLFVVRYLQDATVAGPTADAENLQRRLDQHDGILEELSSLANSHPNIAYLYGRSTGYRHNRFIVLRTGFIPLSHTVRSPGVTLGVVWSMVPKLLDAALHLARFGAVWLPNLVMLSDNVFLDDRGEPTIGLINDLQPSKSVAQRKVYESQLSMITTLLGWTDTTLRGENTPSDRRALLAGPEWPYPQIRDAIAAGCKLGFVHSMLHRPQLANLAPLNHTAQAYLTQLESVFDSENPRAELWGWPQTLRRIVTRSVDRISGGIYVEYRVAPTADSWDLMLIFRIADDGERIDHVYSRVGISPERTGEIRQTLGIVVPDLQPGWRSFEMIHLDDPAERSPADDQWMLKEDDY